MSSATTSNAKYTWERNGRKEKFNSVKDAVRRILRVNEDARNSDTVLEHTFWTDVQGLDLNNRDDFMKKANSSTISRSRRRIQNDENLHFPTEPKQLFKRISNGDFSFDDVVEHYKIKKPRVIEKYVGYIENRVKSGEMTEEEAEEHLGLDVDLDTEE